MFLQTKKEIIKWLDKYNIRKYIINDDLTVDVNGDADLYNKKLTNIPVKFKIVTGSFFCSYNQLTNLEFAPKYVGHNFTCYHNNLTTLQGAPEKVGGKFLCSSNNLTSLQGAPKNQINRIIKHYPDLIHTLSTEELLEII
jgi:hypothetical protein